jgi:hypothetical protein
MSPFARAIDTAPARARSFGAAALIGASLLAAPLAPALAQGTTAPGASSQSGTKMSARDTRAAARAETVEQRIATLHAELKITPAEESNWNAVAQAMRDNAQAMEKLVSDKASQTNMTAVEDLQTYQQFAQARVDGLKTLESSFQTLYNSMPDQQKKLADQVFQNSRHQQTSTQSG